jgi:hypothetical protein
LLKAHAIKLIKSTFNGEVYILAEIFFNIVGNILSQILSSATSHKTMPILQNQQVTVRVTNHPGPLIAQHKRAQAPTKTRQAHRCARPSQKEKKSNTK